MPRVNFDLPRYRRAPIRLVASFVGFKTLEKKIKVEENKTVHLALELLESADQLKEIVVKGYTSPNEKPVSVGKIAIRPMDLPQSIMTTGSAGPCQPAGAAHERRADEH